MTTRFARLGCAIAAVVTLTASMPAAAQTSALTTSFRYDVGGRLIGQIAPDPDGNGPLRFGATRTAYDFTGRIVRIETGELADWQPSSVVPNNWPNFTIFKTEHRAYDTMGQLVRTWVVGSGGTTESVVETNYDREGRPGCTAVRMNKAAFPSLASYSPSACTHWTAGADGADRITKNIYDTSGRLVQVRDAVGVFGVERAEVTYAHTLNGQIAQVIDANGNLAQLCYDGHDRQTRWLFPSTTRPGAFDYSSAAQAVATAGLVNGACTGTNIAWDYEEYGYDDNGNRTSLRKRDGSVLGYEYDALNRMKRKIVPDRADLSDIHEYDVTYTYDLRGLQTSATLRNTAEAAMGSVTTQYDGFGRVDYTDAGMSGDAVRRLDYAYDANGNRLQVTHPGGVDFNYTYDGLNRLQSLSEEATWLMTATYNTRGSLGGLQRDRANSTWTSDNAGRLAGLAHYPTNASANVGWTFQRNPASQITSVLRSNDSYAWKGHYNVVRPYEANGLNQYTTAGATAFCYDKNGNLTADGMYVYLYDVENRLVEKRLQGTSNANCQALSYAGALQVQLRYDAMGRLYEVNAPTLGSVRRLLYDGDALVAEYGANSNDPPLRRFVHGSDAKADDPLLWYEGSGLGQSSRRHLLADHQGSIVGVLDGLGSPLNGKYNSYDEYGIPSSSNQGRFQYTGQAWVPELGMYYYKARIYSPTLGRFMQIDPIGYEDHFNLYSYVVNDPVNLIDPSGNEAGCITLNTGCGMNNAEGNGVSAEAALAIVAVVASVAIDLSNGDMPGTTARSGAAVAAAARAARQADRAGDTARRVPNPHGSRGKPDHQNQVARQEQIARSEAGPGETVVRERKAVGTSRRRNPDVQTRDSNGRTVRVREVERNPGSRRVQEKRDDYRRAGIKCDVVDCNGNPR